MVRTVRERHSLHFRRNADDHVYRDMLVLRRDDGELTTVTLDEFTELEGPRPVRLRRRRMTIDRLHTQHERQFADNRFVYPVLSRRSGGISVGINLNPDKVCNFDCVYCQVNRVSQSETRFVETPQLLDELQQHAATGDLGSDCSTTAKFRDTPPALRRLDGHRLFRRRRTDHASQLRRSRRGLRRTQTTTSARRRCPWC